MSLSTLEPKPIWIHFSKLNQIPRPSKKEEKVIEFIRGFGASLHLQTIVDQTGNVLIRKPATPGMENRKTVILQSHLDMVCQKNNDVQFDFDNEGIRMKIDGDWVTAEGTTLGADNGIGVAAILSILESEFIPHPPLEALFTIDEETGMTGAFGLEPGFLRGEILLNLDTEEDDEIDIGCAGGMDVTAIGEYPVSCQTGTGISLEVKGLRGGHSGMEIHEGRGNVNKIIARILYACLPFGLRLYKIDSGGLRNAIPREGMAEFLVERKEDLSESLAKIKVEISEELRKTEPELHIGISENHFSGEAMSADDSRKIIQSLVAAHNGVFRMSPEIPDLVEASNNIARVELDRGSVKISCLTRSSVESSKMNVAHQLESSFMPAGLEVEFSGSYPGWQPDPGSEIISVMARIYKKLFKENPKIVACHAGLECGIIGSHYPGMEMVSFGPTIKGAHSPDERVQISSVMKFWEFLQNILAEIPLKDDV